MGPTNRPEQPTAMGAQMVLCPYCGSLSTLAKQCNICSGYFDLLSRQRSQNAMGPWFIRDLSKPFQPGCSYATLVRMAQRGKIKPDTVLRGPSTRQFWSFARQTPGVANLLGECHSCHKPVMPTSNACPNCKASFLVPDDRQVLGLSPVHLLPGDADAETIARSLAGHQAPLPRPAAVVPALNPEPVPAPIDPAPVPEPQVIVEEPEWIEEEDDSEPTSGSRVGVVVAVLVFVVMMSGAGIWAWLHLSSRTDQTAQSETPVKSPSAREPEAVVDELLGDELASATTTDDDTTDVARPDRPIDRAGDGTIADGVQTVPDRTPTRPREADIERLAYDRILIGIAEGSLDEPGLEAGLLEVGSERRAPLRRLWERRAAQIRLGRLGV